MASRRESRAMRGQQEVEAGGGARVRARRHASVLLAREEDDRGGSGGGLGRAGPVGGAR